MLNIISIQNIISLCSYKASKQANNIFKFTQYPIFFYRKCSLLHNCILNEILFKNLNISLHIFYGGLNVISL